MSINLGKIGGRGIQSLFISIILHLIILVAAGFFMLSQKQVREEVFTSVDILKYAPVKVKHRLSPPKRKLNLKKISLTNRVSGSVHKISEVIEQAPHPVVADATLDEYSQKANIIPDITTIAKRLRTSEREIRISSAVSTGNKPSPGEGLLSSRQRAGGSGKGRGQGGYGLDIVDTVGVKNLDTNVLDNVPKEPEKELSPYGEALSKIAEHIAANSLTGSVDVVFVMDTSMSMIDNIDKVANNLFSMIETYEKYGIKYRLGVVEFSVRKEGNQIDIDPFTTDPTLLQRRIKSLRLSGDEHALDALSKTLTYMNFNSASDKNLILVTDEPASTEWNVPNAYPILRNRIIADCQASQIAVNVLGYNSSYQRRLAKETGGLWVEIPGGQRKNTPTSKSESSSKAKLMERFRSIAQHISGQVKKVDVVIAVDCSSSMGSKAPLVINGVQSMMRMLELSASGYKITMIRFAVKGIVGAVDGVVITKNLTEIDTVLSLLQVPFGGDEHLLDAVVEGLPKVNFRPNSARFLIIITDEPSTGKYTTEQAIEICKAKSVQVYVIGALPEGIDEKDFQPGTEIQSDDFQFRVVNETGGSFYPMPNSLKFPDPNQ